MVHRHFFPIIVGMLGFAAFKSTLALEALAGGLVAGIGAAVWGLRSTHFERTEQGFFYTPNAHIGIVLALLFVGRIVYRLFEVYSVAGAGQPPPTQDLAQSPLTLLMFGLLAGYYTAYAIGVLRWRQSQRDLPSPGAA